MLYHTNIHRGDRLQCEKAAPCQHREEQAKDRKETRKAPVLMFAGALLAALPNVGFRAWSRPHAQHAPSTAEMKMGNRGAARAKPEGISMLGSRSCVSSTVLNQTMEHKRKSSPGCRLARKGSTAVQTGGEERPSEPTAAISDSTFGAQCCPASSPPSSTFPTAEGTWGRTFPSLIFSPLLLCCFIFSQPTPSRAHPEAAKTNASQLFLKGRSPK